MQQTPNLTSVSDDELLRQLSELVDRSRRVEADLVAHIAEVDARRLYAREAVPSMFAWCTEVLHLSDYESYLRITVARASRKHPLLLTMLRDGRLHLSGIVLLARRLTPENRDDVLKRAAGLPHRRLKELAAELEPKPDAPAKIRKLPVRKSESESGNARQLGTYRAQSPTDGADSAGTACAGGGLLVDAASEPRGGLTDPDDAPRLDLRSATPPPADPAPPARRATVEPLAPARYKVQFTADAELRDMLERLQALMRPSVPDGDLAEIIKAAVAEKLERLEARRFATTKAPRKSLAASDTRPTSRHIPAAVRRAVYRRDEGRCTYVDAQRRRCSARRGLEFHHRDPFGHGGDHSLPNIALLCASHNALLAEHDYGKEVMARYRRSGRWVSERAAVYSTQ